MHNLHTLPGEREVFHCRQVPVSPPFAPLSFRLFLLLAPPLFLPSSPPAALLLPARFSPYPPLYKEDIPDIENYCQYCPISGYTRSLRPSVPWYRQYHNTPQNFHHPVPQEMFLSDKHLLRQPDKCRPVPQDRPFPVIRNWSDLSE